MLKALKVIMVTRSPVLFAYANTDEGQMHLTTCGAGDAVVLLHWTPLSARMYEHEIPTLAELGYQVIAVDLMGFGRSAKPGRVLTFERHAELLGQALCNHGITTCAVLGGHFSAPVAVQLTLGPAPKVNALVLDGCGHLLPPAAAKAIGAKVANLSGPGLHADGSHRTFLWEQAVNAYGIFDPALEVSDATLPQLYRFMLDYLSTGMPADFGSFQPFDMAGKLAQVRVPTCVFTAETDALHAALGPTVDALRKGSAPVSTTILQGAHPLHNPQRRGEYARAIASFLANRPK
jgi:pimeloyl-ACP methyl ester carboxylesterase